MGCTPLEYELNVITEVPFRITATNDTTTDITFALDEGEADVVDFVVDEYTLPSGVVTDLSVSAITYEQQPYYPRNKNDNSGTGVENNGFSLAGMTREAVLDMGCCAPAMPGGQPSKLNSTGSPLAGILRRIKLREDKALTITINNADSTNSGFVAGSLLIRRTK